MNAHRAEKMGNRTGLLRLIDILRNHEGSRQGVGLLLVLVCAWLTEPGEVRVLVGFGIAVIGELFRIYAAGSIFKNKQLATVGAYSLVRHPLYVGNILILAGFSLACGNLLVALLVLVFFGFYYPTAIRYEDTKLHKLFGEDWETWSTRTRALIPGSPDLKALGASEWNARQSMLRNGELYITVYLVACAVWLWFRAHA